MNNLEKLKKSYPAIGIEGIWTDASNVEYDIFSMETSHIKNTIMMLLKFPGVDVFINNGLVVETDPEKLFAYQLVQDKIEELNKELSNR